MPFTILPLKSGILSTRIRNMQKFTDRREKGGLSGYFPGRRALRTAGEKLGGRRRRREEEEEGEEK